MGSTSGALHDGFGVLKRVADVAVGVVGSDIVVVGIRKVSAPLISVVGPGNVAGDQLIADGGDGRGRNGEDGGTGIADVTVGILSVAVVAGVVVVQEIKLAGFAARIDRSG